MEDQLRYEVLDIFRPHQKVRFQVQQQILDQTRKPKMFKMACRNYLLRGYLKKYKKQNFKNETHSL